MEKPISDVPSDHLLATFGEHNLHINNTADIAMLSNNKVVHMIKKDLLDDVYLFLVKLDSLLQPIQKVVKNPTYALM